MQDVSIETAELISALQAASKEAIDVCEATEDASGADLAALGHNGLRDAAKDAHNICNNLIRRLGGEPVLPPEPEPIEQPKPAEAVLQELETKQTNLEKAIEENGNARDAVIEGEPETPEQPPEAIADLFQADKPLAPQALALQRLWVKLGHQVQRGEASPDEIRKHERLSSEIEFINKHAFEGV